MGYCRAITLLSSLTLVVATACHAQDPSDPRGAVAAQAAAGKPGKYLLRLHILAIDDFHRTVRMQPNWCAASTAESLAGGGEATPCAASGSTALGGGEDDFSGAGRADLVSPPSGITGLNFTYEGCSRIRVAPGFHALEARWIKPGVKLEVEVPDDSKSDRQTIYQRCTLKVVPQEFVYLRLHNRAIIRVTPEAYAQKPSLRVFLSGGSETLERRVPTLKVPASSVQ